MHCNLVNHRRLFYDNERLQLLCLNLQAITTFDWIKIIFSILLFNRILFPFHHYVFGFSFHCLLLQELLLLRVHRLVNLNKVLHFPHIFRSSNLSVGVLVIILEHYFSLGTIFMQRYVSVVLRLVQVVWQR